MARQCAIHRVTALGEASRVGGIPHWSKGGRSHACALSILVAPLTATAQPAGTRPRIGVLVPGSPTGPNRGLDALSQGLRDLGYV